jgi:TRAP-type C4-dicarboxylate transport system permease small subunit
MEKLLKLLVDFMVKALEIIMTGMLIVMMVTMFWQVFTRFVIKIPSIWTEEIARASFVYMAMIGAAIGVRRFTHFGMTVVSDRIRGKVRTWYFRILLNGVVLLSSLLILIHGWKFMMQYGFTRVSPTFLVPMAWLFFSIPFSGFFMTIFALYNMLFETYVEEGEKTA